MSGELQHRNQSKVLSDHRRIGSRFIPPLIHKLGQPQEMSWVDTRLPELIWLALLNQRYGVMRGAELALEIARAAIDSLGPAKKIWFAPMSAYANLTEEQQLAVVTNLKKYDLSDLRAGLAIFADFYPYFPMGFLIRGGTRNECPVAGLSDLKTLLRDSFDKTSKVATLMQANAMYIALVTDMLTASPGIAFANLPAVADYPETEESERVGASVRAGIMGLFGMSYENSSPWPGYFWNRGLEIDDCMLGQDDSDE
jgi:hypothetical protein